MPGIPKSAGEKHKGLDKETKQTLASHTQPTAAPCGGSERYPSIPQDAIENSYNKIVPRNIRSGRSID